MLALAGSSFAADDAEPDVTEQSLRQELGPYGRWVRTNWGEAWQPGPGYVAPDFQPYVTGGYWVATEDGWSFVSSLPFGWLVYHYGQWVADPVLGWVWVPGTVWAPAWVDWRMGGGYIGWAPMRPPGWGGSWSGTHWCFVGVGDFLRPEVGAYRQPTEWNAARYSGSTPFDDRRGPHHGPPEADVSRAAGLPVKPAPAIRHPRVVPPPPLAPHAGPGPGDRPPASTRGNASGGSFGHSPVPTHPRAVPGALQPMLPPPVIMPVPVLPGRGHGLRGTGPHGGRPARRVP
jgi:hypothetical protein